MNAPCPTLLGIDVGGTKTAFAVATADGEIIHRTVIDSQACDGLEAMLTRIMTEAEAMISRYNEIHAVGVSIGGPVDSRRGLVLGPPNLPGWTRVPLADRLSERLSIPVRIEHDAKACTLAEWQFGAGRGTNNLVFLTLGTGLGAGVVADGRLLRGAGEAAGEIGHWRVADDGPLSYGKRGSLEGWSSGSGLPLLARLLNPSEFSELAGGEELNHLARSGNAAALDVIARSGEALGRALALVVDLLAPERIVLGNLAARLGDDFLNPMRKVLEAEALPSSLGRCRVVCGELGEKVGDVAAICVAKELAEERENAQNGPT